MTSQFFATFILPLGGIIFIDLILSGDNALVIGAALIGIPARWRKPALLLGGVIAILLRILFTIFATFLLRVNYLQTIGGLLVLWITWRSLVESEQKELSKEAVTHPTDEQNRIGNTSIAPIVRLFGRLGKLTVSTRRLGQKRFLMAVLIIVMTDLSMSLDNIIAVAALARGQLITLGIGLVLSIIILLIGSALVASLLERYPNLIILSGFILACIAGSLISQDMSNFLSFFSQYMPYTSIIIYVLTTSFFVLATHIRRKRTRRSLPPSPEDVQPSESRTLRSSGSVSLTVPLEEDLRLAP